MATEHIKMPEVVPVVRYLADGARVTYPYDFPVFASEDIAVSLSGARRYSGFTVAGAGETEGGSVTFDAAPPAGETIVIERLLPIERMSDFIEGGDFSARALNTELDYLTAAIQQVARYQEGMIRYPDHENPGTLTLPDLMLRANKALGFDGEGNPVPVSLSGSMAAPDYTAGGAGAVTRTSVDKFGDLVSVRDFGAVGDGLSDDTLAIQQAMAAHDSVYVPAGTYLLSGTLTLTEGKSLLGAGQASILKGNAGAGAGYDLIEITGGYNTVSSLRLEGGGAGIRLNGRTGPCVQNTVNDVTVWGAGTGLLLDGYDDGAKPCYWNNFARVLIAQPSVNGVHLMRSGAGDTPNANRFHMVRVYSLGADISGHGFYVEEGSFNNSLIDCEANVKGATAQACFRMGAGSNKTLLINPYAESSNTVPNIRLDDGSRETSIFNLLSASDGAAIYDFSGGNYDAINAGYPDKNRLRRTSVTDLRAALMRFDTEYIDTAGTHDVDLSHSVHLVSAYNGAVTMALPPPGEAVGVSMTFKKTDNTANLVTITEQEDGSGPDGTDLFLGGENDYVTVLSNGAEWFITASNRMAGNTRYFDGSGTYDIDMAVDVYLLSSYGGAMTARLPPANAAQAVGRRITIKKVDTSSNVITVSEQGGSGPDQYAQPLSSQYEAITVVSNGGQWYIVSKF